MGPWGRRVGVEGVVGCRGRGFSCGRIVVGVGGQRGCFFVCRYRRVFVCRSCRSEAGENGGQECLNFLADFTAGVIAVAVPDEGFFKEESTEDEGHEEYRGRKHIRKGKRMTIKETTWRENCRIILGRFAKKTPDYWTSYTSYAPCQWEQTEGLGLKFSLGD